MSLFEKNIQIMNKITAAITAVEPMFLTLFFQTKYGTIVDTNDEWITSRTGIKERRILKDADKGTSYLAIKAAQDLLAKKMLILRYRFNHNGNSYTRHASCCDWVYVATEIGATNALLTCRQLVPVFVWNVCCLSLCSIWKI
jgi:3-oxoacyl-[acyl-carrier-protein] synthase-3